MVLDQREKIIIGLLEMTVPERPTTQGCARRKDNLRHLDPLHLAQTSNAFVCEVDPTLDLSFHRAHPCVLGRSGTAISSNQSIFLFCDLETISNSLTNPANAT